MLIGGIVFRLGSVYDCNCEILFYMKGSKDNEVDQNHTFKRRKRLEGAINAKKNLI